MPRKVFVSLHVCPKFGQTWESYAETGLALFASVVKGFRQYENFRIAIRFFLGKLEVNRRKSS